ncbi:MAG: helix-turn-helix domain-containing protein [Pseudomonadota bacterium]
MDNQKKSVRGSKTGRPIMRLLDVLGRRWALRIIWELRDERLTFRELRERCDDVSPTSLNQRLKELRELQLIDHNDEGFGYTDWGRELGEQMFELDRWAEKWGKAV